LRFLNDLISCASVMICPGGCPPGFAHYLRVLDGAVAGTILAGAFGQQVMAEQSAASGDVTAFPACAHRQANSDPVTSGTADGVRPWGTSSLVLQLLTAGSCWLDGR
jgi:hypothetical protein